MRTDADVRKWLPGDTVFEDPLFAPPDLAPGNYDVSVALLDPVTLQPGIQLAIEGRGSDGWYTLGKIHVASQSATRLSASRRHSRLSTR